MYTFCNIKLVDIQNEIDRSCMYYEKRSHTETEQQKKKRKLSRVWTIIIILIIRMY
jgi:hypothetical protein